MTRGRERGTDHTLCLMDSYLDNEQTTGNFIYSVPHSVLLPLIGELFAVRAALSIDRLPVILYERVAVDIRRLQHGLLRVAQLRHPAKNASRFEGFPMFVPSLSWQNDRF